VQDFESDGSVVVLTGKNGRTRKSGQQKNDRISSSAIYAMIESQEFKCALTGRVLEPSTAAIDHKIPLSAGGAHAITNMQAVHSQVNQAKGTMTQEEFIAMCCEVAKLHG
jgi:5-methylcytosine-specific restriction endonuclease McrA